MALYGGMMYTYSGDVDKLKKAKACEKATEEKAAGVGGGSGNTNAGDGSEAKESSGSPSPTPQDTTTSPTVTATATSVICEGSSISTANKSNGTSTEVSYVGCAFYSEKARTTEVAVMSSTSGANGSTTDIVAACVGAASTTESGTSGGTICGGIAVHGSNDSKSDDGTTAIVACVSADAEVSSKSKDGGTSRLVIQNCVGVAMRKTQQKGLYIVAQHKTRIAFPKKSKSSK